MDIPASTALTIGEPAFSPAQRRRRSLVLGLTMIAVIVGAVAVLRLAALTAATPPRSWLVELPPTLGSAAYDDPAVARRAAIVAGWLSDPATIAARFGRCREDLASGATPKTMTYCVDLIDAGLREAPTSGELWLAKAVWQLQTKAPMTDVIRSLETSFRVSPREAWIAAGRVVLGLRLYPLLTAELQEDVRNDLELVLKTNTYGPLVRAYVDEPSLRVAAQPALETLSETRLALFLDQVRRATRNPA